ncbi:MAG: hypothetical protein KatS3mg009_1671 [Acidimicrobiia bacterium]|nr:MAG: hypothetical protein KatS3mg009_1671 [Acidimicrobiia bacterium]
MRAWPGDSPSTTTTVRPAPRCGSTRRRPPRSWSSPAGSRRRPSPRAPTAARGSLAAVALVDLLDAAAPHPRAGELIELADDAPTLHVFVVDEGTRCRHRRWRDPLREEWEDVVRGPGPHALR